MVYYVTNKPTLECATMTAYRKNGGDLRLEYDHLAGETKREEVVAFLTYSRSENTPLLVLSPDGKYELVVASEMEETDSVLGVWYEPESYIIEYREHPFQEIKSQAAENPNWVALRVVKFPIASC